MTLSTLPTLPRSVVSLVVHAVRVLPGCVFTTPQKPEERESTTSGAVSAYDARCGHVPVTKRLFVLLSLFSHRSDPWPNGISSRLLRAFHFAKPQPPITRFQA